MASGNTASSARDSRSLGMSRKIPFFSTAVTYPAAQTSSTARYNQAVAARFPAERYEVRTPLFYPGPGLARPFVLGSVGPDVREPLPDQLWWGFAFD